MPTPDIVHPHPRQSPRRSCGPPPCPQSAAVAPRRQLR